MKITRNERDLDYMPPVGMRVEWMPVGRMRLSFLSNIGGQDFRARDYLGHFTNSSAGEGPFKNSAAA